MYAERLLTLARHVEKLKPEQFDYSVVGHPSSRRGSTQCGSAGCLMGHAAEALQGQGEGLKLKYTTIKPTDDAPWWYFSYGRVSGLDFLQAAQLVFGITGGEASYLFANGYAMLKGKSDKAKVTRRMAAQHIRRFVTNKQCGVPTGAGI